MVIAFLTIYTQTNDCTNASPQKYILSHFLFIFLINTGGLHFGNWFLIFAARPLCPSHRSFHCCKRFFSIRVKKIKFEHCFRFLHSEKEPSLLNFVNYQAVWTIEWTKWRTKKNIQSSKCSLCNKQNCLLEHWTHQINFNDYIISILSSLLCFALRCVALPWLLLPFYSEIRDQEIKNHKVNFEFCFELMRSILNNNTKISTWKRFHSCDVCVSVCVCMLVSTKLSKIFVLIWTIWIKTIVFLQSSMTWQQFTFCCFSLFFIFFFIFAPHRHHFCNIHHKANLYIQLIWFNLLKMMQNNIIFRLRCFCFDFIWLIDFLLRHFDWFHSI